MRNLSLYALKFIRDCYRLGIITAFASLRRHFGEGRFSLKVNNHKFLIRKDQSDFDTLRQVFSHQEYKLPLEFMSRLYEKYEELSKSGRQPVIIDLGANIGAASVYLKQTFPLANVIAVEPDNESVEILEANLACSNINFIHAAIGSTPGYVTLRKSKLAWATQTQRSEKGVQIITINEILKLADSSELFIVKIDIEGFEEDLFDGNTDWVATTFCIIIEPHDWMFPDRVTSRSFRRVLCDAGFQLIIRGENIVYIRRSL